MIFDILSNVYPHFFFQTCNLDMFMIKCILFVYTLTNQYFSLEAMTDLNFANKSSGEFK